MPLRIGVIMYQTSLSKGQELVAQRMVKEFDRLGHAAYLITSTYHDGKEVVSEEEIAKRGGYVHLFDQSLGIPVIRVGSEMANWPPRRILFRNFVGVLTRIVSDLKLNVLIGHSTLWNGPEEATKFVVWNRRLASEGAANPPVLLCQMSHFQEASDERYTVEERTFRETWNRVSLGEILRQADLVLVTTPFEAEQMKELGASDAKCFLFPGGVEEEIFDSPDRGVNIRRKLALPASAKLVTSVGTVEERKNILSVVEVAKRFEQSDGVHFVIAGRLDGPYAEAVAKAARGMRSVTLAGEISDHEKAALIDESFVNLTMSRSEALGIAQLEFMSRGVPVISSGVGGQSWVVREGANGILLKGPDDVDGASKAISFLVENPKVRKDLSLEAAKTSSQASLSHLVASLARRLSDLLAKQPESTQVQQGREKVIEAMVHGRRKVTVTTQRLIVSSAKTGKMMVSIPFSQIVRISRMVRRPWLVLITGLGISVLGFIVEMRFQPQAGLMFNGIEALVFGRTSALAGSLLGILVPLVPAAAAVVLFWRRIRDGFIVHYGQAQKIFLASEFVAALRTAHSLSAGVRGQMDEPD